MFVIPVSNDNSQSFRIDLDNYPATVILKSSAIQCLETNPVVMDIFVEGFPPVYGIPLIPLEDALAKSVSSGCLPLDIGAIIPVPDINGEVTIEGLSEGFSILTYFNGYETFSLGLFPYLIG